MQSDLDLIQWNEFLLLLFNEDLKLNSLQIGDVHDCGVTSFSLLFRNKVVKLARRALHTQACE